MVRNSLMRLGKSFKRSIDTMYQPKAIFNIPSSQTAIWVEGSIITRGFQKRQHGRICQNIRCCCLITPSCRNLLIPLTTRSPAFTKFLTTEFSGSPRRNLLGPSRRFLSWRALKYSGTSFQWARAQHLRVLVGARGSKACRANRRRIAPENIVLPNCLHRFFAINWTDLYQSSNSHDLKSVFNNKESAIVYNDSLLYLLFSEG